MANTKLAELILRVAVAGEFLGHGVFALQGKQAWIGWISQMLNVETATAITLLTLIGVMDLMVAALALFWPMRLALLWATLWGAWTALVRPLVGEPIWDFVERFANWGAPLALLFLRGWPKSGKEWWR